MDNSIFKNQNDKHLLKCLVAQRREYSLAKKADAGKNIATVLFAVLSVFSSIIDNDVLSAISCLVAIVLLITSQHITIFTMKHRKHAALVQQYFDVTLFSSVVEQDAMQWGPLPTKTDLVESISTVDDSMVESMKNWYSDYSNLAPIWQIFCCQKENIRWDSKLRSEFKLLIIIALLLVLLALVITAFAINPSFIKCICVLAYFLPIADYCFSFIRKLREDINRLNRLKARSEDVEKLLSNNNFQKGYYELIILQHQIMDSRENAIFVPDWFYQFRKDKYQKSEDKITDILQNMSNKSH